MTPLESIGIRSITLSELARGIRPQNRREQARVDAVLSILREYPATYKDDRPIICSPRAAGDYLLPLFVGKTEEEFGILALNAKGYLVGMTILSKGTCTATLISPREFFREALRYGATTALAFHNHPSGDPTPSREDLQLTRRLRAAGESLGVPLADHLILGANRWHSFRAAEGWDNGASC